MSAAKQTGVPMQGGAEYDAFTRWRRFLYPRPGKFKAGKRSFWRRARKALKVRLDEET